MYFKMLHYHIVRQSISLVPILPIVHMMIESFFVQSIHVYTIPIQKNISHISNPYQQVLNEYFLYCCKLKTAKLITYR